MLTPQQHQEHMQMVEDGLNQILASEDINEIKQIAQSLLGAEAQEKQVEGGARPIKKSFADELMEAKRMQSGQQEV